MTPAAYKFYILLGVLCLMGYLWLAFYLGSFGHFHEEIGVCIIKEISGLPCPSCGTTRSVVLILQGQFFEAIEINPFGFLVAGILFLAPFWISADLLFRKSTLYAFYRAFEIRVASRKYAIPLIFLVLANWAWNLTKLA